MKFHDGTDFNADAVIWNLERFYNPESKQFDTQGGAISRARNPLLKAWRKIDDYTVEITTSRPVSYFPYVLTYTLIASPTQFEKTGASWAEFAKAPVGHRALQDHRGQAAGQRRAVEERRLLGQEQDPEARQDAC